VTKKGIFLQILSEAIGKSLKDIELIAAAGLPMLKETGRMGAELSDEDAAKLLAKLRSEMQNIQRWLAEGNLLAQADMAKQQGPAN